jgi:hypothetical protein
MIMAWAAVYIAMGSIVSLSWRTWIALASFALAAAAAVSNTHAHGLVPPPGTLLGLGGSLLWRELFLRLEQGKGDKWGGGGSGAGGFHLLLGLG